MAWVLLLASAAAVLLTGLFGTALILGGLTRWPAQIGPGFWIRLVAACGLTVASLALRSLRWVFLLRRAETRIPIRDAYIGYFAGLSLLLAPFLLGEIAVRALVLRARGHVPVATTVIVNLWERLLDLAALAVIAGMLGVALGGGGSRTTVLLVLAGALLIRPVRAVCLRLIVRIGTQAGRVFDRARAPSCDRLARTSTWLVALGHEHRCLDAAGNRVLGPGGCVGVRLRPPDGRACVRDCQPAWVVWCCRLAACWWRVPVCWTRSMRRVLT